MKAQPSDDIQRQVGEIWHAVLGITVENTDENFFVLGGNSIQAMEITTRLNEQFNLDLDIGDFFDALTIKKLSLLIAG